MLLLLYTTTRFAFRMPDISRTGTDGFVLVRMSFGDRLPEGRDLGIGNAGLTACNTLQHLAAAFGATVGSVFHHTCCCLAT